MPCAGEIAQEARLRREIENVGAVDERRHDEQRRIARRAIIEEARRAVLPNAPAGRRVRGGRDDGDSARCRRGTRPRGARSSRSSAAAIGSRAAAARLSLQGCRLACELGPQGQRAAPQQRQGGARAEPCRARVQEMQRQRPRALARRRHPAHRRNPATRWPRRRRPMKSRAMLSASAGSPAMRHQMVLPQVDIPLGKLSDIRRIRHVVSISVRVGDGQMGSRGALAAML